jgi:alpha-galactosidase
MFGITYNKEKRAWNLATEQMSYVLGVSKDGNLLNFYWGAKLKGSLNYLFHETSLAYPFESYTSLSNEEYPAWGGIRYSEPCLKVEFNDGVRDCLLQFKSYIIEDDQVPHLILILQDPTYPLEVRLHYELFNEYDIIRRWAEIINNGTNPIKLEQVFSGVWYLPKGRSWRFTYLAGKWANETQIEEEFLKPGKKIIESRRGTTSPQANPFFLIDNGEATESTGEVWFGCLAWSGNWKIIAEQTPYEQLRIVGGINDFDFSWHLEPGEKFITPKFIGGYSRFGFGSASRKLHKFQREKILPKRFADKLRPILYNTWEATFFNIDENKLMKLATLAASLGIELFVIDDGWFKGRDNDKAGLGDWIVDPKKFPSGFKPLINHVNKLGMMFGLWIEPEMVNPNSELYKLHPDWVYNFPNRPRSEMRNQLILNLCRDDVKEYVFNSIDHLLSENNIKFIKWDMNRHFSEPGWPEAPKEKQKEIWVRHTLSVYEIIDKLRSRHPDVLFECCSGGGGRVDLGSMENFDQFWTSDNTDALDRLFIQEGFSMAYAPKTMVAWVTDVPNWLTNRAFSLEYRFHVAMMGTLGISGDLTKWNEKDFEIAKQMISLYKRIRPIIQEGEVYRLLSPRHGNIVAVEYASQDAKEAVLFVFTTLLRQSKMPIPPIRLAGLVPEWEYSINLTKPGIPGKVLMEYGIRPDLTGDFQSKLYHFVKI